MRSGWYQGRDERSSELALDKHSDDEEMTQVGTQLALSQTIYLNQYKHYPHSPFLLVGTLLHDLMLSQLDLHILSSLIPQRTLNFHQWILQLQLEEELNYL